MEKLATADEYLNNALERYDRDCKAQVAKLNLEQQVLKKRFGRLDDMKLETARETGDVDAANDDLIEINAGGKLIAAKRSKLTQLKGTRMAALFSGRWDKKLQRDSSGRIFLDVNSVCFQAIVDYLNELAISSEDDPPNPPSVSEDHKYILGHQLELFGFLSTMEFPGSTIIKDSAIINDECKVTQLHEWLKEDDSDGQFGLLYRGSRDGLTGQSFHSKCDNQGCTLTIIETADGFVIGGYSNTPWASNVSWTRAGKAFLFALSGSDIASPCKLKLKDAGNDHAIYHNSPYGPSFGTGHDLYVKGTTVFLYSASYEPGPMGRLTTPNNGSYASFTIKEMEVFQISSHGKTSELFQITPAREQQSLHEIPNFEPVDRFSKDVNKAINAKQDSLLQAASEIHYLEDSFKDEQHFIEALVSGDTNDVLALNVSGTVMTTTRSTLCTAADSVLAQQFDDSKWTQQGCNTSRVAEWTPDDVGDWAENIPGIQEDVISILKENKINGYELTALNMEGLEKLGINRPGTLCLLLKETKKLERASQDVVTLIEHSPYCFGAILDYLRLKQLHSQGLIEEPALAKVCETQKNRFEKVVKYYFPGESAKFILG